MSSKGFLEDMKKIQANLIDFLEYGDNSNEKYQNLIKIFNEINIHDNQLIIKPLLYLISKISNNHHRKSDIFSKIEKILHLFTDDMKKYFSNNDLFHIFKSNKRLLLFLFEEKIMIMNEVIFQKITNNKKYLNTKYPQYFQPEIRPFINDKNEEEEELPNYFNGWAEEIKKELPENFYEKRKIGENDNEICKLIQKDLIEDFIIYVNKNCYPANSTINSSIYETNNFLLKNEDITLIEYAAFFGSIQVFNYLKQNGAELKSSLWIYAVHGHNPEIINFLEENNIVQSKDDISYKKIFKESIKCHHNYFAYYIQDNYIQESKNDILINSLKYYNFMFIQPNIDTETSFCYLCKYDYYLLAYILYKNIDIDINKKIILIMIL